jgi:hypothetical protein
VPRQPELNSQHLGSRKRAFENLVKALVEARKNATPPLTQADLARLLCKRHQSQVAKLEMLERELKLDDLVLWARAVGEDPAQLLRAFEEDLAPGNRRSGSKRS